ncbi:MAG: hypothetical protein ACOY0T_00015 [Myxococcota bacterium]
MGWSGNVSGVFSCALALFALGCAGTGSLDTTFSGDGIVQSFSAAIDLLVEDVIVDSSNRTIVVGPCLLPP